MNDNTYTINSIDDKGNANITYQIAGVQYTQDLINLPIGDANSVIGRINQYVQNAIEQLAPPVTNLPDDVVALIGQVQTADIDDEALQIEQVAEGKPVLERPVEEGALNGV